MLSQASQRASRTSRTSSNARSRGNILNPIGLTYPEQVAKYNASSSKQVIVTHFCDKDVLIWLVLLDAICSLFAQGTTVNFQRLGAAHLMSSLFIFWVYCMRRLWVGLIVKRDIIPSVSIFMSLIWVPLVVYLVFHWVWTCLINTCPKTSTRMLFGIKFLESIGMIQVSLKASLLETPVSEWLRDYLLMVYLLGRIVWMCVPYLNYISCIACFKVTDLTPIPSWSISYTVWPLVQYIGLWLGGPYCPLN